MISSSTHLLFGHKPKQKLITEIIITNQSNICVEKVQKHSLIFLDFWEVIFVRGFLPWNYTLKLVSAIFCQFSISHQIIALKNYEKCFLFHLKSSFRSRDIQIFVFPSSPLFLPVSHCFRDWSKINLKVYDVINCLNKNLYHVSIIPVRFHAVMKFISDRTFVSI